MATLNWYNIQEELLIFIRNQDILSTTQRGATTTSQNFTGDGATSTFDVTNSASLKNVRSITVNGSAQTQYLNYTANYEASPIGRITFASIPALNSTISVSYDYGSDRIYSDIPRVDLDASSYPRIACVVTDANGQTMAINGVASLNNIQVDVTAYDTKNRDVMNKVTSIRQAVNNNRKNFQFFTYIEPIGQSRVIEDPGRRGKIAQQTVTLVIPNQVESV